VTGVQTCALPIFDLADRDPEELFRLSFARRHGVGPEPVHLDAFAEIREEV
jgi:exonuclease SbcD